MKYKIIEFKNGFDRTFFVVRRIGLFFDKKFNISNGWLTYERQHYTLDDAKLAAKDDFDDLIRRREARATEKKRNKLTRITTHVINFE